MKKFSLVLYRWREWTGGALGSTGGPYDDLVWDDGDNLMWDDGDNATWDD